MGPIDLSADISDLRAPTLPINSFLARNGISPTFASIRSSAVNSLKQPFVSESASSFRGLRTHLSASPMFTAASCTAISIRMTISRNFDVMYRSSRKVFPWLPV